MLKIQNLLHVCSGSEAEEVKTESAAVESGSTADAKDSKDKEAKAKTTDMNQVRLLQELQGEIV